MVTGQTKDVGWNIGVSKTLPHSITEVWDLLTSRDGIEIWLGAGVPAIGEKGETYETADGTRGEIRSHHPHDRMRLTWRPASWDHDTTMQVTVVAQGSRTRVGFHQEWLANAEEREQQRSHWQQVMKAFGDALAQAR
jgi:uncharacterized protein YndB with AHSA1/START domain